MTWLREMTDLFRAYRRSNKEYKRSLEALERSIKTKGARMNLYAVCPPDMHNEAMDYVTYLRAVYYLEEHEALERTAQIIKRKGVLPKLGA